ncbi:FliC/FljB family flagellin [Kluyvera huaxiensis]|uniref:FliC/FljB family flagellin n=1 Tax=Kluyvera sp. 142053 TaxID=3160979 RepID=UPI0032DF56C7
MAQVINTNSLSLITQNNINKNQSALSSSIERLSSGLRINSAKDDAAGQAIANRFTSNIKGLTQAARNANDGISVAQTTEGALSEINNNLQRVRELTVQATTGTNSQSDLDSIQDEIKSRLSEIDRVSAQTQFNGVNVLAKDGTMKIQVGANDGQTISIDLKKIDSSTLKLSGFNINSQANVSTTNTPVYGATGATIVDSVAGDNSAVDPNAVVAAATVKFDQASGKYYGTVSGSTNTAMNGDYEVNVDATSGKATVAANAVKLTAMPTGASVKAVTKVEEAIDLSNSAAAATLKSAGVNTSGLSLVKLSTTDANGIVTDTGKFGLLAKDGTTYATDYNPATYNSTATPPTPINATTVAYKAADGSSKTGVVHLGGDNGTTSLVTLGTGADAVTYNSADLAGADLSNSATAPKSVVDNSNPLKALDSAIAAVDKFRSSLGAVQNQLDSAVTNLNNTTTNLSEAQSRIQDADYATEVSNMSKAQIIQQAGNSVLAKANQVPQQVLSLLQG